MERVVVESSTTTIQMNGSNYHLGDMKNYHSLIPMSQTNPKPILELTSRDGVEGGLLYIVAQCGRLYSSIAA